ncbi:phosphate-starvation-inducible PsiE family protein [Halorubrum sp. 2020YC2]|uniref:phosphate-starvation-inducible PsiE family protein n=1 Tax=Halorubrum sp. 2020YC2 TaxID=2836432 RepID=UPI001BEAF3B9|nr:phosphate-starvation-inducible PsiE family protein [Halorubrum sp. 2020YC2]QWC20563.1 phosphate-starvation-inducible PsiE family protein [Halorubrum sp. 2020YC2]
MADSSAVDPSDDPSGPEHASDSAAAKTRGDRVSDATNRFIHGVELAAAALFALLFGIGVVDLAIQIVESVPTGAITDPNVVIGFIETGLLLLIIVEVYETVVAYIEQSDTRRIVRLVIYTGVIAMVRKVIIFRTTEYPSTQDALFAAVSYTIIIGGLVALLFVERSVGSSLMAE